MRVLSDVEIITHAKTLLVTRKLLKQHRIAAIPALYFFFHDLAFTEAELKAGATHAGLVLALLTEIPPDSKELVESLCENTVELASAILSKNSDNQDLYFAELLAHYKQLVG